MVIFVNPVFGYKMLSSQSWQVFFTWIWKYSTSVPL